jgi:hypothetical protein
VVEVAMAFAGTRAPASAPVGRSTVWSLLRSASSCSSGPTSALSLTTVFGLFNIVYGITAVVLAAQARRVASTARTVAGTTAA